MESIQKRFADLCKRASDINEHLPTLYEYGKECAHITECGVRGAVSTWAFLAAKPTRLVSIDPVRTANIDAVETESKRNYIAYTFIKDSDLKCAMESTELLFIDTWHVYGQLKRELARWHSNVSKYIILHDTTVDGILGETIRSKLDAKKQSRESGIPEHEILKGLWPAVEEFLAEHSEWTLDKRYTNNNGLTILKRTV
jgi:hypothetical protein